MKGGGIAQKTVPDEEEFKQKILELEQKVVELELQIEEQEESEDDIYKELFGAFKSEKKQKEDTMDDLLDTLRKA